MRSLSPSPYGARCPSAASCAVPPAVIDVPRAGRELNAIALRLSGGNPRVVRLGGCLYLRKPRRLRRDIGGLRDFRISLMVGRGLGDF